MVRRTRQEGTLPDATRIRHQPATNAPMRTPSSAIPAPTAAAKSSFRTRCWAGGSGAATGRVGVDERCR
jgi:hypothetical protein